MGGDVVCRLAVIGTLGQPPVGAGGKAGGQAGLAGAGADERLGGRRTEKQEAGGQEAGV